MNTTALAAHGVPLPRRFVVYALLLPRFVPSRAHATGAVGRAGDCLCSGGGGLQRRLGPHGSTQQPAWRVTRWHRGGRHAVGPDDAGHPRQCHEPHQRRENSFLPSGRDHAGGACCCRWRWRDLGLAYSAQAQGVDLARRPWGVCRPPHLDVAAAAPPGHANEFVHLSHRCLRWCWACCCWRATHAAAGAGAGGVAVGISAGEPQAGEERISGSACSGSAFTGQRHIPAETPRAGNIASLLTTLSMGWPSSSFDRQFLFCR